jgi:hypothetical protein
VAGSLAAAALAVAGCGSGDVATKTVTVTKTTATSAAASATSTVPVARTPAKPVNAYEHCDANIRARKATTTCGFAENTFYAYYKSFGATTLAVWSPAVQHTFSTHCSRAAGIVTCRTADRGVVKFPQSAVDAYDEQQAAAFASTHDVGDSARTPSAPSTSVADGPDYGSADDDSDSVADSPDYGSADDDSDSSSFCDTHDCIPNYPNGNGSTVQCADGSYSHSGGIQGACSHHGGVG